jgi:hypothetical protein
MARAGLNVHASGVKVDYIIEAIVKAAVREARIEQIVKETQCEQEVEGLLTELTEITEQIEGAVESLDKTLAPLGEEPADNDESQRSS